MLVVPNTMLTSVLDSLTVLPLAPLFDGTMVRLFSNNLTPIPATVIGDLTEATFSGYAAIASTWGPTFVGADGRITRVLDSVQFNHNGGVVGEMIYGFYLTDAAGAILYGAERFADGPFPMVQALQAIAVLAQLTLRNQP